MAILTSTTAPLAVAALPLRLAPVVVVYEDLESARYAKDNWKSLMRRLELPEDSRSSFWKFNLLQNPKLSQVVTNEADGAGSLIISVRGEGDFSDEVKQWLEQWLNSRTPGSTSLLVLLDPNRVTYYGRDAICNYLEALAERTGIQGLYEIPE